MDIITIAMVASGLFFGWTIGSHYTGATMGMAYGSGIVKRPLTATALVALFALLGATFESRHVVETIGTGIIKGTDMTPLGAMTMMFTAAVVTAANTWMRWPVSTSQLACFSVVGTAIAMGAPVFWGSTIVFLCVTWVATPLVAAVFGWVFTRATDWTIKGRSDTVQKILGYALFIASCYSSYTLGANNTGNAVGVFFGLKLTTEMQAGFIGGIVIAIGALTWGVPLLQKVGKDLVQVDLSVGVGAKFAQSVTAHIAAVLGFPTSMNQAQIGGVAGAAYVRGLQTIDMAAMKEIVLSWFLTPVVAGVVSFFLYHLFSFILKIH
ncbi:MAG TPA: inorganic phosphate transporter [Syntrophobacteraceae bacterium]|nr:inorganic phosphate transporter [Syntrophobacteraceae bacterium]